MLRITASTSAGQAKSYYTEGFSKDDYYTEGQDIIGKWGGKGAELLGLSGQVDREAFMALCDNLHPQTGERLTARTKAFRTVGYDFTFDVPKSVSVIHAISGDHGIVDVMNEAIEETMREVEAEVRTRVRRDGVKDENRITANLIRAHFTHFTARPEDGIPDPHLHVHCYVFNATFDGVEDKWKAALLRDIVQNAPFYQSLYHNRLAIKLKALGYEIERRGKAFEIVGVPDASIERFSRRTKKINKIAAALGITSAEAKGKLGAATRQAKNKDLSPKELRALWLGRIPEVELKAIEAVIRGRGQMKEQRKASVEHLSPALLATAQAGRLSALTPEEELAIQYARMHSFEKASVINDRRFLETVLQFGVGQVDLFRVRASVAERQDLLRQHVDGRMMLTTPEVLAEERAIVAWAKAWKGMEPALAGDYIPTTGFLSAEQRAAIQHILNSRDRVTGVQGRAGAGKTTLMKEAIAAMETRGQRVLVLTPRAEAAYETLVREGFKRTETVSQLLLNETLQKEFQGGVWWIDEAGQLSARDMYKLVNLADQCNSRLILSGDIRQHGPVERGDALRILKEHAGLELVQIGQIQRQTGKFRTAVEHFSEGKMKERFDILDSLDWISEVSNEERHLQLAKEYLAALKEKATALVISPTHAECRKVTEQIRSELINDGQIKDERVLHTLHQIELSEAQRRDARTYRPGFMIEMIKSAPQFAPGERLEVTAINRTPQGGLTVRREDGREVDFPVHKLGDRFQVYENEEISVGKGEKISFTKNGWSADDKYRLHNGSRRTIADFTPSGDLRLDNGVVVSKDYAHLTYGYAVTSHAAQGKTVDRVFIAESAESFGAASQEQFYVSASRGKHLCRVFTNDKEDLLDAVQNTSQRVAALDLMKNENQALDHYEELRRAQQRAEARLPAEVPIKVHAMSLQRKLGREQMRPEPSRREPEQRSMRM
ncbi:MAG: MobF family relaxase [Phycisphaerae bacterium]